MKRLILLTTLAAAIVPATASAWPGRPSDPPYAGDPAPSEPDWRSDRDRGYDSYDARHDREYHNRWVTLSAFTPGRKGRETVYLNRGERRIDRVRISAVRGAPVVNQVIIQYRNGQYERKPIHQQLRPGQDAIISLDTGRRVQKVMVLTDPRAGGAYSLHGAG